MDSLLVWGWMASTLQSPCHLRAWRFGALTGPRRRSRRADRQRNRRRLRTPGPCGVRGGEAGPPRSAATRRGTRGSDAASRPAARPRAPTARAHCTNWPACVRNVDSRRALGSRSGRM